MSAKYPATPYALNPQNTANDGAWPNPNLAQAQDYNLHDEEIKAIADDLRAAIAPEEVLDEDVVSISTVIASHRAALVAIQEALDLLVGLTAGSVTATELATDSVTTSKLADNSVTQEKLDATLLPITVITGAPSTTTATIPSVVIDSVTGFIYTLTDATPSANVWSLVTLTP